MLVISETKMQMQVIFEKMEKALKIFDSKDLASVEIFSIKNAPIVKWFWFEYNLVILWKSDECNNSVVILF